MLQIYCDDPYMKAVHFVAVATMLPTPFLSRFPLKMPPDRPGSLGDEMYAQLLAYILQENGSLPGARFSPKRWRRLHATPIKNLQGTHENERHRYDHNFR